MLSFWVRRSFAKDFELKVLRTPVLKLHRSRSEEDPHLRGQQSTIEDTVLLPILLILVFHFL